MIQDGDNNFNEEDVLEKDYSHYSYLVDQDQLKAKRKTTELVLEEISSKYCFYNNIAYKTCQSLISDYGPEVKEKVGFLRDMICQSNKFQIQNLIHNINKQFNLEIITIQHEDIASLNPIPLITFEPDSIKKNDNHDFSKDLLEAKFQLLDDKTTVLGFYINCHQVDLYRIIRLICEHGKSTDLINSHWVLIYTDLINRKFKGKKLIEAELSRKLNAKINIGYVLDPIESIDCFISFDKHRSLLEEKDFSIKAYKDFLHKEEDLAVVALMDDLLELNYKSFSSEVYKVNLYAKKIFGEDVINISDECDYLYKSYFKELKNYELNDSLMHENYNRVLNSLELKTKKQNCSNIKNALILQGAINSYYRVSSLNKVNKEIFKKYKLPPFYSFENEESLFGFIDLLIYNLPCELEDFQNQVKFLLKEANRDLRNSFEELIEANKKIVCSDSRGPYHRLIDEYSIYDESLSS